MAREEGVTILDQNDLKYLLIDTLKLYSKDIEYISGSNPYLFNINKKSFYILIKNLHDSGIGRTNSDESRIQISWTSNFSSAKNSGKPVIILGYSKKDDTFTAWNPFMFLERINRKRNVSLFSRFTIQKKASVDGISEYVDYKSQRIISFRPEYLGLYLENYQEMHQSNEETLLNLVKQSELIPETESKGTELNINKKKFIVTHKVYKRDAAFKKVIYEIYENRCSICGIQLELIEAAHIVPHSDTKGSDDPINGICLCSLHHKAYDGGLIYFDEGYTIKMNKAKVDYLQKTKKDGGILKFLNLQNNTLILPKHKSYYPSSEYIKIANKLRGIDYD